MAEYKTKVGTEKLLLQIFLLSQPVPLLQREIEW
jgi:hypothetical protein